MWVDNSQRNYYIECMENTNRNAGREVKAIAQMQTVIDFIITHNRIPVSTNPEESDIHRLFNKFKASKKGHNNCVFYPSLEKMIVEANVSDYFDKHIWDVNRTNKAEKLKYKILSSDSQNAYETLTQNEKNVLSEYIKEGIFTPPEGYVLTRKEKRGIDNLREVLEFIKNNNRVPSKSDETSLKNRYYYYLRIKRGIIIRTWYQSYDALIAEYGLENYFTKENENEVDV